MDRTPAFVAIPPDARVFPLAPDSKVPLHAGYRESAQPALSPYIATGPYGMLLEGQYVVIDFDKDGPHPWHDALPDTWKQRTKRGVHYLYRLPDGINLDEFRNTKFDAGDIKVRGYIVGPGTTIGDTTYTILDDRQPEPLPDFVLAHMVEVRRQAAVTTEAGTLERIGEGVRDDSLAALGGLLRRQGLNEIAIREGLAALNMAIVDPPVDTEAVHRIAKSVSHYEPGINLSLKRGRTSDEVEFAGPTIRWHVRGFVPRGELVMLYGPGGIGKSSFGSWLAAHITNRNERVAALCVEESWEEWAWRAALGGSVRKYVHEIPSPTAWAFPRNCKDLQELIQQDSLKLVWIDSIYSHFETFEGMNSAEKARKCLAPLAAVAKETGCTIIGVFHENKGGQYLGSTEMENVGRVMLRASREQRPNEPLKIYVKKSNLRMPTTAMAFKGEVVPKADPGTGQVQMEEDETGKEVAQTVTLARRVDDVPIHSMSTEGIADDEVRD